MRHTLRIRHACKKEGDGNVVRASGYYCCTSCEQGGMVGTLFGDGGRRGEVRYGCDCVFDLENYYTFFKKYVASVSPKDSDKGGQ